MRNLLGPSSWALVGLNRTCMVSNLEPSWIWKVDLYNKRSLPIKSTMYMHILYLIQWLINIIFFPFFLKIFKSFTSSRFPSCLTTAILNDELLSCHHHDISGEMMVLKTLQTYCLTSQPLIVCTSNVQTSIIIIIPQRLYHHHHY